MNADGWPRRTIMIIVFVVLECSSLQVNTPPSLLYYISLPKSVPKMAGCRPIYDSGRLRVGLVNVTAFYCRIETFIVMVYV